MELPDFLCPLKEISRPFPREAMDIAIERREESVPVLLAALESTAARPERVGPADMLHEFALYLLAQFRETRALESAVRLARYPEIDDLLGDTITEFLGSILASLYGGELGPIQSLIEDEEAYEFARSAGITALGCLYRADLLPRESLIAYLRLLFEEKLERTPSFVWDGMVILCSDLGLSELIEPIRSAYALKLVDPMVEPLQRLEKHLLGGPEGFPRTQDQYILIDDAVACMRDWYCFKPEAAEDDEDDDDLFYDDWEDDTPLFPPVDPYWAAPPPSLPKPARNDPCPCGSGKKFKKCCGAPGSK